MVNSHVKFTPINIIKSESDGIWLTGLGQEADIITLGQGFVRAGDKVEAVFSTAELMNNVDKKSAKVLSNKLATSLSEG